MTSASSRVIAIMAKAPIPGMAKTRLIPTLGPEGAAMLSWHMLLDSIEIACLALKGCGSVYVVCPTATDCTLLQRMLPGKVDTVAHERSDLMAGLEFALGYLLGEGFEQVVLFNGDTPTLPPDILQSAFDKLLPDTIVMGGTYDGGYYLIGARQRLPSLFRWEVFDGSTIFRQTRERIAALGLTTVQLPMWQDVDTGEDFQLLCTQLEKDALNAIHTRHFLTTL